MSKSGMYGELPSIQIGDYTISDMSENNSDSVWVMNTVTGEGAEFKKDKIGNVIEDFFNKNF